MSSKPTKRDLLPLCGGFLLFLFQNILILLPSLVFASDLLKEEFFSFGGEFKQETAYRIVKPISFTKMLNLVRVETSYFPTNKFKITARGKFQYDAVYDFQRADNIAPRTNPRVILSEGNLTSEQLEQLQINNLRGIQDRQKRTELRELYVDISIQNTDFRLGKQIVRWGVVEGGGITDNINPFDLEEFILREIQDRYIPLWMAKIDHYPADGSELELLWIPDLQPHKPAPRGTEWEQLQTLENLQLPGQNIRNSEWAFKRSQRFGDWDTSLSYFYNWDDFPSAFRSFNENDQFGESPEVEFGPRLTRIHSFGSTFSNSFPQYVFNGEFSLVLGKMFGTRLGAINRRTGRFETEDGSGAFGEKKRSYLKYGAGFDFNLFGVDMTFIGVQQFIIGYRKSLVQPEWDTLFSVFFRENFLSERLFFQMLTLYFVNDQESLLRPRLDYQINSTVKLSFGADIFGGKIGGPLPGEFNFIGFFKNNDRIFFEISYGF